MAQISVRLDEEVLRWARDRSSEEGLSLSRYLESMLWERMAEEDCYRRSMQRYLALEPVELSSPNQDLPMREDLHDRQDRR